jgi:hypothetical protein
MDNSGGGLFLISNYVSRRMETHNKMQKTIKLVELATC